MFHKRRHEWNVESRPLCRKRIISSLWHDYTNISSILIEGINNLCEKNTSQANFRYHPSSSIKTSRNIKMPHRDYFYEPIYPIGIKPKTFPLFSRSSPLFRKRHHKSLSWRGRMNLFFATFRSRYENCYYEPRYELFVKTQKMAKGSITLSEIPSKQVLLL